MGMKRDLFEVSGVWTGRFDYGDGALKSGPFSAWLRAEAGRVTGSMLEPNKLFKDHGDELDASLRGHVHDEELVFLKTYHGVDEEPIYCEGTILDDGLRIAGRWYFGWPDEQTGTFEMRRDAVSPAMVGRVAASSKP